MRIMASFVMVMYFFIVVAYLFFTPRFQYKHPSGITKAKTNTQLIYTLIRTNRCMMSNNKLFKVLVKQHVAYASLLKFGINELPFSCVGNAVALTIPADHYPAYLSNRVLRI
jgi:hypothetical protein